MTARSAKREVRVPVTSAADLQAGDTAHFESPTMTVMGLVIDVRHAEGTVQVRAFGHDIWVDLDRFTTGARTAELTEAEETYTVAQIREAFAKHAGEDTWGVKAIYETGLIASLRGEYDEAGERPGEEKP